MRRPAPRWLALLALLTPACVSPGPAVDPAPAEMAYREGLELRAQRRPHRALRAFSRALEVDPLRYDAHYQRGACYYSLGEYSLEIAEYEKCLALNPHYLRALRDLGTAHLLRDELVRARTAYQRYLNLDPDRALVLFNLALVEQDLGNVARARALWEQTLKAKGETRWQRAAERRLRDLR